MYKCVYFVCEYVRVSASTWGGQNWIIWGGVSQSYEWPDLVVENITQVLWKRMKCSKLLNHLSNFFVPFFLNYQSIIFHLFILTHNQYHVLFFSSDINQLPRNERVCYAKSWFLFVLMCNLLKYLPPPTQHCLWHFSCFSPFSLLNVLVRVSIAAMKHPDWKESWGERGLLCLHFQTTVYQ